MDKATQLWSGCIVAV